MQLLHDQEPYDLQADTIAEAIKSTGSKFILNLKDETGDAWSELNYTVTVEYYDSSAKPTIDMSNVKDEITIHRGETIKISAPVTKPNSTRTIEFDRWAYDKTYTAIKGVNAWFNDESDEFYISASDDADINADTPKIYMGTKTDIDGTEYKLSGGKDCTLVVKEALATPTPTAEVSSALAASKAALEDQLKNTPAPTETPAPVAKGQMGNFNVSLDYVGDDSWGEQSWGDKSVNVTKDGDYSIEYTATSDSTGIYLMMLDTDLYYGSLADNFALTVKNVKIGDKTYAIDNKGCWGFADQTVSKNYRFNIVNPWNGLFDKTGVKWQDEKVTTIDKLNKAPVKANDKIVVNFNVTTKKASSTVSIKAAKSKVSVAPSKSATVKYTVKGTSTVKATSNNKAVTVKVNKSKKNVTITAKKTAVMGKTATITLKVGSKKSTIKVTVAKTANVKKKKTANYTVALAKVTKKVKAKKIKVSVKNKKVAKVTVKKTAKGQVTFQVKGLKKGKTTATLKYGKKSAKVSVVVK